MIRRRKRNYDDPIRHPDHRRPRTRREFLAQGFILVGLVWAAWYFPLIQLGYRFPEHPGLGGFLLMPLGTIALSVIAGWLYQVSGSIWAPTVFHTGVLVTADFSLVGLGDHGRDLRLRTVWVLLWVILAILTTFFWPF